MRIASSRSRYKRRHEKKVEKTLALVLEKPVYVGISPLATSSIRNGNKAAITTYKKLVPKNETFPNHRDKDAI